MTGHGVRWRQRFSNFRRALARLVEAVELSDQRPTNHKFTARAAKPQCEPNLNPPQLTAT